MSETGHEHRSGALRAVDPAGDGAARPTRKRAEADMRWWHGELVALRPAVPAGTGSRGR